MDDAALARLEHENLLDTWARLGAVPGGHVEDAGGVALRLSGAQAAFFNQILVLDDPAAVDPAAVARAVALARSRGAPFLALLRAGLDDPLHPLLAELGLVETHPDQRTPAMAIEPLPAPRPPHPVLEIREVVTAADSAIWLETAIEGFGMPPDLGRSVMAPVASPSATLFPLVGYVDGVPAVVGQGIMTGRTVGVYTVATLAAYRRQGYGEAMTRRVIEMGAGRGADVAILQASDMGRPVYEAIGFRTVLRYAAFMEPAPDP